MKDVISVSQINFYIKSIIENDLNLKRVFVIGEISNLSNHYKSGHVYFSLKDEKSVIKAVMFAQNARKIRFALKDGMKVLVKARVSLYEATGQYQLYVDDMQPDGLGALNLAYEQLWDKLKQEGLFENKKALPFYPQKIAVITSSTGAAVRDIFSILQRRWPVAKIKLYPCTVQGENAVPELISSLLKADEDNNDVIIIGRGGGSLEDLWAFNSEELARKIAACKTAVVSAVGHENDFTICDYVADLRAATPSEAAEKVTPDIDIEFQRIKSFKSFLLSSINTKIDNHEMRLDSLKPPETLIKNRIQNAEDRLNAVKDRLKYSKSLYFEEKTHILQKLASNLDNLSPLKTMARGYSLVKKGEKLVNSVKDLSENDNLDIIMTDGTVKARVNLVKSEK